jgi:hypothetical protein
MVLGGLMDRIITMTHLNTFIGRYSAKRHRQSVEQKTGWDVEGNFLEKIPILALRNRDMENESPLSWRSDRNLRHAITLTLDRLKAWQAFRPMNSDRVVRKVGMDLPGIIKKFQRQLIEFHVESLWDIMDLEQNRYNKVVILVAETVGNLSLYKSDLYPMLGSKIMHLFLPEFFPIWDTAWIKKRCLVNEYKNIETRLSPELFLELNSHSKASVEYGRYFALMLQDLMKTGKSEYKKITNALIRYSRIPKEVIDYHFFDVSTIVFEFCLLGKHIGCKN